MSVPHVLPRFAIAIVAAIALIVPAEAAFAAPARPQSSSQVVAHVKRFISSPKPTISGHAEVGSVLRVVTRPWKPSKVHLDYQWLRDGHVIPSATHKAYTIRTVDRQHRVSISVRGTKRGYRAVTKLSASIAVPKAAQPKPSPAPSTSVRPTAAPVPAPVASTLAPAPVQPAPAPVSSASTTPSNAAFNGNGQFLVGSAVQPGVYVTARATSGCYWEANSSFDGQFSSINANDFGSGQRIIQIDPADHGVTTRDCGSWLRSADAPAISAISAGEYFVGQQITPGTYQATGTSSDGSGCYWETSSDFRDSASSVIANDYGSGGMSIATITSDAKAFKTSGCTDWTRVS